MKIQNFLLSILACTSLLSCSKDDTTTIVDPTQNESYVAVDIVMPSNPATRANEDFEAGTAEENKVLSVVFLFFDANGNGCADPVLITERDLEWSNGSGSIDKISVPVLVLNPVVGTTPSSMIAIVNPREIYTMATSLSDIKSFTDSELIPNDPPIMTNSVYSENGNTIVTTPLSLSNLATSRELALANPVVIPVERVVAKVALTDGSLKVRSERIKETIDGQTSYLQVVIKGWKTTVTNPTSLLIKKIDPSWNLSWNWNDASNKRSYWAESTVPTSGYTTYTYNDAIANAANSFEYCYENTSSTPTQLYVAARVQDLQGNPIDLVEFRGTKYTKAGFKNYVANLLKKYHYKISINTYGTILPEHIDFVMSTSGDNQVVAALSSSAPTTFYTVSNNVETDATAELKAELAKITNIKLWNNGNCYFFTDILHDKASKTTGIVRNHVYKLTIKSLAGLGSPVYNPDQVVVPEKPVDENSYISAEVEILKWKVVSQDIDLK